MYNICFLCSREKVQTLILTLSLQTILYAQNIAKLLLKILPKTIQQAAGGLNSCISSNKPIM